MNGCIGAGQGVALGKDFTAVDEALLPQQLWNWMEWRVTVRPRTAPPRAGARVALSTALSHADPGASSCSLPAATGPPHFLVCGWKSEGRRVTLGSIMGRGGRTSRSLSLQPAGEIGLP